MRYEAKKTGGKSLLLNGLFTWLGKGEDGKWREEMRVFPYLARAMDKGWVKFSTQAHQKPSSQIRRKAGEKILIKLNLRFCPIYLFKLHIFFLIILAFHYLYQTHIKGN